MFSLLLRRDFPPPLPCPGRFALSILARFTMAWPVGTAAKRSFWTTRIGIEEYGWSSLADYLAPPRKRTGWVQVTRGLEQKEIRGDIVFMLLIEKDF